MHILAHTDALRIAFGSLLAALLVALSVSDIKAFILPDRTNALLAVSGVAQSLALGAPAFRDAALGSIVGGALLMLLAETYRSARGIEGLGLGDIKLVSAAGLWVGWQGLPLLLATASTTALAFAVLRTARSGRSAIAAPLPFGPFLAGGTMVGWLSPMLT
jgi:leader peptidase (prepilin peptidase)/N-methyltransferase